MREITIVTASMQVSVEVGGPPHDHPGLLLIAASGRAWPAG